MDWPMLSPGSRGEEKSQKRFKRQIPRTDICLALGNVEGQPPPEKKEDKDKQIITSSYSNMPKTCKP